MKHTNARPPEAKTVLANPRVVFEDADLIVVDKPAGLPTQGTPDPRRPHLYAWVLEYLLAKQHHYAGLHHRLDSPTSGLVLFTKSKAINKGVTDLFRDKKIEKIYQLIAVSNERPPDSWTVENHLKKISQKVQRMKVVQSGGDFAKTDFRLLKSEAAYHLIEARPKTGRMHQIRIHIENSEMKIWGDRVYGKVGVLPEAKGPTSATHGGPGLRLRAPERLYLHAAELIFEHPKTKNLMHLKSHCPFELPKEE